MKLSQKAKIVLKEHSILRQLSPKLPLKTPFSVLIDPSNICNFRCTFCPTGYPGLIKKAGRPKGMMNFSLFTKIIDEMQGFDQKMEKINLYKDGEPFLNKNLDKMISYAKRKNIAKNISTTSNGSLMDKTRAIEVIEAGLDIIKISVENVSDEGYKRTTRTITKYDTIRKNVEFLFNEKEKRGAGLKIFAKINDVDLSDFEKERFIKDFSPISDSINVTPLNGWNNSYGYDFTLGLGPSINTTAYANTPLKKDRKICPDIFYSMSVNFNGLVSTCCVDWSLGLVIGDASKENIVDVWRGEKLQKLRMLHLEGKRDKIRICSNCQVIQSAPIESDIDDDSERLLKLYRQNK